MTTRRLYQCQAAHALTGDLLPDVAETARVLRTITGIQTEDGQTTIYCGASWQTTVPATQLLTIWVVL